jgi:hypothetical protein
LVSLRQPLLGSLTRHNRGLPYADSFGFDGSNCWGIARQHTSSFASTRNTALANEFEFFCMRGKPTYESLEEAAVALKLHPKKDLARDMGNGNRIRSKSRTVGDNTGAYELVALDAVNGDVPVESCGIGSADGLGGEVFADLQAHYNLGPRKRAFLQMAKSKRLSGLWSRAKRSF